MRARARGGRKAGEMTNEIQSHRIDHPIQSDLRDKGRAMASAIIR